MKIKESVKIEGISAELVLIIGICEKIYHKINPKYEITITSVTDGKHSRNSLHYVGKALDIRTYDMNKDEKNMFITEVKTVLYNWVDIIDEGDHIHIEYNKKKGGVKL
ncbi:hypothetical protein [Microviridae sp.]|nr:hypothetical protein [Microviridae sp.]